MKRWITRFALGAKCGGLGKSELVLLSGDPNDLAARPSVKSPASAILPTPTPHSRKKWRRAMELFGWYVIVSALGDGLVEIE
jgi:hypothetical protein